MWILVWSGLGAVALLVVIGAAWIISLRPKTTDVTAAPPIARDEVDATIAALQAPKRRRPLVAIVGINNKTETTDYLMPCGILRRAGMRTADFVAMQLEYPWQTPQ